MYTSDSVAIAERADFMNSCTSAAAKKTMEIDGLVVDADKYCGCVCDEVMPTFHSSDLYKAMNSGKLIELLLNDDNRSKLMACVESNLEVQESYKFDNDSKLAKDLAVVSCVDEITKDTSGIAWTKDQATSYCQCAMDRLYAKGYTYKDLLEIEDENSIAFNEIAVPCVPEGITEEEDEVANEYELGDIKGRRSSCKVPLIKALDGSYKVKITIGKSSKYFLFDTGASDMMIDSTTFNNMKENGDLKGAKLAGTNTYIMADDSEMEAKLYEIDNVKIGKFKVNNVIIAVSQSGSPICGTSFLDKFKNWKFNPAVPELELFKK